MIHVMKLSRTAFATGGLVWTLALAGLAGCGSDDDGSGPATGGTGGGATGGSGGATGGQGGAATGGQGGAATGGQGGSAGAPAGCASYCDTVQTNCAGGDMQYPSKDACLNVCALFPPGLANDQSGNSLSCRSYHATAAASDSKLHCPHAGPSGAGTCGTGCEGYCNIMLTTCSSEFKGPTDCVSSCSLYTGADATDYNTSFVSGDSLNCRIYHATVAASDPAGGTATIHCPHSGVKPTDQCL